MDLTFEGTVRKISYGLDTMNIDKEELNACMTLDQFQNDTFASNHNDNAAAPNTKTFPLKFYLIGEQEVTFRS